ncbi:non-ribosomal peptide synthetase [Pseudoramibacter alactolyticus]|uniref:non-ribosomal peptide synthetase n=1 Tax=Pseudoramibacter alactolyticus TaxID=113287 RepID=UPI0028D2E4B6|nr:non-ribosomal peptide synthetase [Pseudoramibacter alactolyticus]
MERCRALYEQICRIAAALKENGTEKGDRVVIALPKSRWQLAACLAVLSLGAAYVPVDVGYGEKRCEKILDKVNESCVLCHSEYRIAVSGEHRIIRVDKLENDIRSLPETKMSDSDTAYIIFTSGSTGEPKGVEISHRAAVNTIEAVNDLYGVNHNDRIFGISQLNFDLSVYDMFGVIARGGAVVIPDHEQYKNPAHWAEMMRRYNVTIWNTVPALMQMLVIYKQYNESAVLSPLRLAMLSGDWIPVDLPDEIKRIFAGIKVVSLGGATEGGIWSIYHEYAPADRALSSIPYGKPLPNQGFMIKDELMQDCPDFVRGELYISGDSLAEGYYGEKESTEKAFIVHKGISMYKTGDTGCYHPDGNIEFMGRNDDQVKLHGHRIELGEVETVMKKVFGLENISCLIHGSANDKKLSAVVVSKTDISEGEAAVRLAPWLPDYMIPTVIVRADHIPLTANGKIDNKAVRILVDKHIERNGSLSSDHEDLSETEKKVGLIICDALDISSIAPDRDLYEEGANSLVLARAAGRLRSNINPQITFDDYLVHLLNTPNVRAVSAFIDNFGKDAGGAKAESTAGRSVRYQKNGSDKLNIIFTEAVPTDMMSRLESTDDDLALAGRDADVKELLAKAKKYGAVSLGAYDSSLKEILELASSLVEKGVIPEHVNILESETESDADFSSMYAGDIRFGLTVSDISEADEIKNIMEELCMGDVTVTGCHDDAAAADFMLDK